MDKHTNEPDWKTLAFLCDAAQCCILVYMIYNALDLAIYLIQNV